MRRLPTLDQLRKVLSYDEMTGIFTWLVDRKGTKAGRAAGHKTKRGYITIRIDGAAFYAHRLAWFFVYGEWPTNEVDHIDLDKSNNAIENLRQATPSQNRANTSIRKNNTSGFKGVSWKNDKSKWQAHIRVCGKTEFIGYFGSREEAHSSYCDAARRAFGEFWMAA